MNRDFLELLQSFNDQGVDYLLVGAHALAVHGYIRATKDMDVFIRPTLENAGRAFRALALYGAPLDELTVEDLATEGTIFQVGVAPLRIDVITRIDGLSFDEAWPGHIEASVGGLTVPVLSRSDLIRNKRAAARLQDLADVEWLERGQD